MHITFLFMMVIKTCAVLNVKEIPNNQCYSLLGGLYHSIVAVVSLLNAVDSSKSKR
jgi:hypothetical protein